MSIAISTNNKTNLGYVMNKKIVLPGDQLSTSEELLVGEGTYEEDGIIRSSRLGEYNVDEQKRQAMVKPLTSVPVLIQKGDLVLAEVTSVRSSMIICNVFHVKGKKRAITGDTNGTLHISEISNGYIKSPEEVFILGDIFRAKVIQVNPSLQLTTKGKDLGVIRALCKECRHPLAMKENTLECSNCGHKEKRKTAFDYGTFNIDEL